MYLSTTDPDVVATIDRNRAAEPDFRARALAWAKERGSERAFINRFGSRTTITGLDGRPEGFGRWTKPDHHGRSKPFANNQTEIDAMHALQWDAEPVPGMPEVVSSTTNSQGQLWLMQPAPFVVDGVAYIGFPHPVEPADRAQIGDQWTECLASKYYAAEEARLAASTGAA